jgi:hypothetical protein
MDSTMVTVAVPVALLLIDSRCKQGCQVFLGTKYQNGKISQNTTKYVYFKAI